MAIIQKPWRTKYTVCNILQGSCGDIQYLPSGPYKKDEDFLGHLSSSVGQDFWSYGKATYHRMIELKKEHFQAHRIGIHDQAECAEFATRTRILMLQRIIFNKLCWEHVHKQFPATMYTEDVSLARDWAVICDMDKPFVSKDEPLFLNPRHIANTLIGCITDALTGKGDSQTDQEMSSFFPDIGEVRLGCVTDPELRALWNVKRRLDEALSVMGDHFEDKDKYERWARSVSHAEALVSEMRVSRLRDQSALVEMLFWTCVREHLPSTALLQMLSLRGGWQVIGRPAFEHQLEEILRQSIEELKDGEDEEPGE